MAEKMTLEQVRDALYAIHDDERPAPMRKEARAWASVIDAHHVTLADMAKRLEAAERKIGRLTAMRNEWERDAREHLMTFGQHLPASVECLVERFDAAIAATQEGKG